MEVLEGKPDLIGTGGLEMAGGKAGQCVTLMLGQVGWIAQPDVTGPRQQPLGLLFCPPHLIDRIVDDLDSMELVEGDGGTGQVLGRTLGESRAHVDADLGDGRGIAVVRHQIIGSGHSAPTRLKQLPARIPYPGALGYFPEADNTHNS
jgi:hypothetical protein